MAKNLFDYGNENLEELNKNEISSDKNNSQYQQKSSSYNNNSNTYSNINNGFSNNQNKNQKDIEEQAKSLYNHYKDYSQDSLINEFLSTSKQKLEDGSLTQEKINSTANALLPYLNDNQKQMMLNLLEKLND